MKKFFALMLVVAMLSVAGSAMAASPTVTASETSFTIKAGGPSKTITVTATAGNPRGVLSALRVSGADWVTLSGNTVTFAPSASVNAGTYYVGVAVTEIYTPGSAAGHASFPITASGIATIAVSVLDANATGTQAVVKVTEVVTTVTRSVTIISAKARESAVVQTFEQVTRTVTETLSSAALVMVKGFTQALADTWQTKRADVEAAKKAVVDAVASSTARRAEVFPGLPATAVVTPRENTLLQPATSSISSDATPEQKLAAATAALGENSGKKALSAGEAVRPAEAGTYTFPKTFGSDLYGTKIGGSRNKQNRTRVSSSFSAAAAADDEQGVAFVNSAGTKVDYIPGDESPDQIMPGFVNMLVVMEANEVYEPVVFATTADLAANSVDVDTQSVDVVVVNSVAEETTEAVVDVNADGSVSNETVVEKADTTTESKMATAMGASSITMVPASSYGAKISSSVLAAEDALAASQDLHVAARIGRPLKNLGTGTYYYEVSFDALPSGRILLLGTSFVFYPDGIEDGSEAYVKVFDKSGNEVTNPANILGQTGIVAFEINSDSGIRTSNFDNTLENPTVTLKMAAKDSGSHETTTDSVIKELETLGYVSGSTITNDGFAQKVTFSDSVYSGTVRLNFPVVPSSWKVAVAGNGSITASAIGTITGATSRDATIFLNKSDITAGTHTVTLSVRPTYNGVTASSDVTASLGSVVGNPGKTGVGSSSGGCSAGSAVLALAVLGAFIKARKK